MHNEEKKLSFIERAMAEVNMEGEIEEQTALEELENMPAFIRMRLSLEDKIKTLNKWLISWGDWSKDFPFVLVKQEENNYVWHEYAIMSFIYNNYNLKLKQQALYNDNWRNIDQLTIIAITDNDWLEDFEKTIYFDITGVFNQ